MLFDEKDFAEGCEACFSLMDHYLRYTNAVEDNPNKENLKKALEEEYNLYKEIVPIKVRNKMNIHNRNIVNIEKALRED